MYGKTYTDYDLCSKCKGECCKQMAGAYHPKDIENLSEQTVLELLLKGYHAIDWYEGDPRIDLLKWDNTIPENALSTVYYLRARHVGKKAIEGAHRGNVCVNYTKSKGCSLSEEQRPLECRSLIPKMVHGEPVCYSKKQDKGDKRSIAIAWIKYQSILIGAMNAYRETIKSKKWKSSTQQPM